MFGLLKKKLSTFSDKLKQTAGAQPESASAQKKQMEKEEPKAKKEEKAQERALEEKKEIKAEAKKEEPSKKRTKEEIAEEMEQKLFAEIEKEMGEDIREEPAKRELEGKKTQTWEEKKIDAKEELEALKEAEEEIAAEEDQKNEEAAAEEIGKGAEEKTQMQEEKKTATLEKQEKKKGLLDFVFGRKKVEKAEEKKIEEKKAEIKTEIKAEEKKKPLEIIAEEIRAEEKKAPDKEELAEEIEDIEEELAEERGKETILQEDEKKAAEEEQNQRMEEKRKQLEDFEIKSAEEDKRELKASVGAGGKLKGMLFGGVEISEKDIAELLDELELSLIESDVEQDAAVEIVKQIKASLIGKKVPAKSLDGYLNGEIKRILAEMMATEQINVLKEAKAKEPKPYRILMLGPNGAGKTTSIAKLANYFQKNKMSVIFAAGDTFRAAAIDQLEEHAKRLNVRVVKQQYGADPAAVAFDAIKAAEAGKIDVVIIDSAGRQETNKNLMEELKKLERVAKPDLKIYVGEAYAGQGLLDQAKEFDEMTGIDGFILTKIDTDAKGGTAISLLYKTKKPILFVGTGQGYEDFEEFTPEFILERII